jgi:Asp-tRNA(Asn)/Glu-tRNA(Gln) amidotransferase A subunit family amidase
MHYCVPMRGGSPDSNLTETSVTGSRQKILTKEIGIRIPTEIAKKHRNLSPGRNTYLATSDENISRQLDQLDSSDHGPLAGIPVSIKDCFDVAGYPTSVGSRFYQEQSGICAADSGVARRVRSAGGIITGKTHLNQLAYGLTGENLDFGNCLQPANPALLTGGSSSGAAASILEGSAMCAIGTDTGGSIRFPASLCGLYGFRASLGVGSWEGGHHLAESFDTIGFLFRHLEDALQLGEAIFELPRPRTAPRFKTIGVVEGNFLRDAEPDVIEGALDWGRLLEQRGFLLEKFAPIDWEEALEVFRPIQAFEAAKYHAGNFNEFEPGIRARLEWGASLGSSELETLRERHELFVLRMQELFGRYDLLLWPVAPIARLENGADTQLVRDRVLRYTTPASVAGLPCLALPNRVGGAQLAAPHGSDRELLRVASLLAATQQREMTNGA